MFYNQSENLNDSRFSDGNISKDHELLKSDCNIIHFYLETNFKFDSDNKYKYYNPDLIRNNGLIKKDQQIHCDFQTIIIPCPCVTKNLSIASSNKVVDQTPVNSPKRKHTRNTKKK